MKEWIAVLRAADTAARWHVHQRRKGIAQEPYINHLLEVVDENTRWCRRLRSSMRGSGDNSASPASGNYAGTRLSSELGPFFPGGLNLSTQHFILKKRWGVW